MASYEFEIKFKNVKKQQFLHILKYAYDEYKIDNYEMDLNIIENKNNTSSIRRRTYYNDKAVKINKDPIIIKKNNINKKFINNTYDYDLSLSQSIEEPIEKYNFGANILIRLKKRLSFKINDNFRLDMSVVKNEQNITNLDVIINKFYKGYNEKNFSNNELFIDNYEIEIEYIGQEIIELKYLEDHLDEVMNLLQIFKNPINEIYSIITDNHKKYNIKFRDIINEAKQLNKFTYYKNIFPASGYILLEKTDGLRTICALLNNTLYLLFTVSEKNLYKKLPSNIFSKYNFIVDAEFIDGKVYVFDILYINNKPIFRDNYVTRLTYINEFKNIIDKIKSYNKNILDINIKKYNIINNNFKQLIETYYLEAKAEKKNVDGLIIAEPNKNYFETVNWKWKSFNDNTIDFYAKLITKENNLCIYHLYSYINYDMFNKLKTSKSDFIPINNHPNIIHVLFTPSIDPKAYIFKYKDNSLNNKVIEVGKKRDNMEWTLHKIRDDKEFGNHLQTAEMTYYNFYSPFDLEMLYTFDDKNYFINENITNKVDNFKSLRLYNTKVKYNLFSMFKDSDFVLDLAAGRGADLNKYNANNIKNVLMVEPDEAAIYDILDRKYSLLKDKYKKNTNTKIYLLKENLTNNYLDTYDKINKLVSLKSFNHICSHFAIHYFIYNNELMLNFINLLNLTLSKHGIFICTLFDGNKLKNFLSNYNNYEWKNDKYYIRLLKNKTEIELLLPFSNNELYKEHLVNIDDFILEMKNNQIKLIEKKSFIDYNFDNIILDDYDKTFIGFYTSLIFTKI